MASRPESILRIGVAVLPPHLKMIDHGVTAGDRFSHLTSVQYQMAVAALAPDAGLRLERTGGAARRPRCRPSWRASRFGRRRGSSRRLSAGWPAHVTVTRLGPARATVNHVPGDPARPFGEDD